MGICFACVRVAMGGDGEGRGSRRTVVGRASAGCVKECMTGFNGRAASLTGWVLRIVWPCVVHWCSGWAWRATGMGAHSGVSPGGERCERGHVFLECACDYHCAGRGGRRSPANVFWLRLMMPSLRAHTTSAMCSPRIRAWSFGERSARGARGSDRGVSDAGSFANPNGGHYALVLRVIRAYPPMPVSLPIGLDEALPSPLPQLSIPPETTMLPESVCYRSLRMMHRGLLWCSSASHQTGDGQVAYSPCDLSCGVSIAYPQSVVPKVVSGCDGWRGLACHGAGSRGW
jgi:hypothetical protein